MSLNLLLKEERAASVPCYTVWLLYAHFPCTLSAWCFGGNCSRCELWRNVWKVMDTEACCDSGTTLPNFTQQYFVSNFMHSMIPYPTLLCAELHCQMTTLPLPLCYVCWWYAGIQCWCYAGIQCWYAGIQCQCAEIQMLMICWNTMLMICWNTMLMIYMCWNTMLMICAKIQCWSYVLEYMCSMEYNADDVLECWWCAGIQCWRYAEIQCWWYARIQCWYVLEHNADDRLQYNADTCWNTTLMICWNTMLICAGIQCWWYAGIQCWWCAGINAADMLELNVTKHKYQKVPKFMRWQQTHARTHHQTQQCDASLWLWPWIFLGKINIRVLQNILLCNECLWIWCTSLWGLCRQKILNLFRRLWDTQPLFQSPKCSRSMWLSPKS